jgi:hypothetical protein
VLLKISYLLMRWSFGLVALVSRGDRAKDAQLLALRHENAVLRRHAIRVRYEPADRAWFATLAPFIPRRRWAGVFPVTPATLLAWHRRLVAEVRHEHPPPAWPPADRAEHRPDRGPPGEGESAVGLPTDPRQAHQSRRHRRAVDQL